MTQEQIEAYQTQRKPRATYVLMLKVPNQTGAQWFESQIRGSYDECSKQFKAGSLGEQYEVRLIEVS